MYVYGSLIIVLALFFGLLHRELVFGLEKGLRAEGKIIRGANQPSATSVYQAIDKEDLLLKIILPQEFFVSTVIFNKNRLLLEKIKLRKQRRIYYVYIPQKIVFKGENQLSMKFQKPLGIENSVDLRFSNYITKKSDGIVVSFLSSQFFSNKKHSLSFSFMLIFFIFVFLILAFKFYLNLSLEVVCKHAVLMCIYNSIILGGLCYFPMMFGYRIAIAEYFYFNLHAIGMLMYLCSIAIRWMGTAIAIHYKKSI